MDINLSYVVKKEVVGETGMTLICHGEMWGFGSQKYIEVFLNKLFGEVLVPDV